MLLIDVPWGFVSVLNLPLRDSYSVFAVGYFMNVSPLLQKFFKVHLGIYFTSKKVPQGNIYLDGWFLDG